VRLAIRASLALMLVVICFATAHAQWLNYPTPGIPRLPDGKPDLNAPAPRLPDGKPDLTGIWAKDVQNFLDYFYDLAKDLPPDSVVMTAWAKGIQEQRERRDHVDDPLGYCLLPGVPRINTSSASFKILQTPTTLAMLYELDTGPGPIFRQVITDGRPLPENPEPTWLGYSIGQWEGDTFVISTAGLRDGGWIDTQKGRPHSDALRVTERIRRLTFGRMELVITIDDPKAYVKPWTVSVPFRLVVDRELLEASCENHQKTMEHRRMDPAPPEPPSPPLTGATK
jgi:hypothetical protein